MLSPLVAFLIHKRLGVLQFLGTVVYVVYKGKNLLIFKHLLRD